MPRPRSRTSARLGGNRAARGNTGRVIGYVFQPVEKVERPDPHVGEEGYTECSSCGYWVRSRVDGTPRAHATDGNAYSPMKPAGAGRCLGSEPRDGSEWKDRQRQLKEVEE